MTELLTAALGFILAMVSLVLIKVAPSAIEFYKVRKDIKAAAPNASESIGYQMPMYKQDGPLVAFGGWKEHCSFYIMSTAVHDAHKADLKAYDTSKGTVRFPTDKPLPASLVRKLVKARLAENAEVVKQRAAKAAARKAQRKAVA